MSIGRLLVRGTVGGFFIGHGAQKLTTSFDGHGLEGTAAMFEQLGLHPPKAQAVAAGLGEAGGGLGLVLGYRTPLASSALIATMLTAINRVHGKNGPWSTNGGYEYNAVLIAAAVALADVGPGKLSLDALRGQEKTGLKSTLTAVTLGVAGAVAAHLITEALAPAPGPDPVSVTDSAPVADPVVPDEPAITVIAPVPDADPVAAPEVPEAQEPPTVTDVDGEAPPES
jgi:putative oxidoreductase